MDDTIAKPIWLEGFGKQYCADCRSAPYITYRRIRVDICNKCQKGLTAMGETHPERILAYEMSVGKWCYTEGVAPGTDPFGPKAVGGDNDVPFRFGVKRTIDNLGDWPAKFYLAMVKLRSEVQNQRIASHTVNQDGF